MIAPGREDELIAQLGRSIFDSRIKPTLSSEQTGHLVVIDTASGDYEVSPDDVQAVLKLSQRVTPGKFYFVRVDHGTPYRIGGPDLRVNA